MTNDYYNSEGYYDPTAGEALRNATSFRIVHPTGYVQIETDSFFPCTVEKSKKLFRMVRQYCSQKQQDELLKLMLKRAVQLSNEALRLDNCLSTLDPRSEEYASASHALQQVKRDHTRITRNIEDFVGRRSAR